MTRNSGISEQECFSYGIRTPEVQFVPNPSTRSNHRLLTPSLTSTLFDHDDQTTNLNHDYEDPSHLAQQTLSSNSRGPRKKANDLYEPMSVPLKSLNNVKHRVRTLSRSSDEDSTTTGYTYHGREPKFHRIILYLVLLLSLTATTLVILMILGIVGPSCHCGSNQTAAYTSQGKTSQQFSLSVNPIKKTIEELQANLTELEALLNKTKAQANVQTNGSISILDVQRNFDQKLNATKDQLQAADGIIKGEVTALNISLINKIQGISVIEGKQGPPGLNGSLGDPGPQGIQGPPGLGNFSQCQHSVESQTTHDQKIISITVNKLQPNGYVILSAFCSTLGTKEQRLEVFVPKDGNPNFVCTCKGKSTLFPKTDSKYSCNLNYFICPKTTQNGIDIVVQNIQVDLL